MFSKQGFIWLHHCVSCKIGSRLIVRCAAADHITVSEHIPGWGRFTSLLEEKMAVKSFFGPAIVIIDDKKIYKLKTLALPHKHNIFFRMSQNSDAMIFASGYLTDDLVNFEFLDHLKILLVFVGLYGKCRWPSTG